MDACKVRLVSSGVATWGTPVPTGKGDAWFNYETRGITKLSFDGGETIHLSGFITGMDRIMADGAVPEGFGHFQMQDIEGHALFGRVEWFMEGEADKGRFHFTDGTGKFEGAQGLVEVDLAGMPANLAAPYPPSGPMDFTGFTEGAGTLSAPAFSV